jgi:hypothetical protein
VYLDPGSTETDTLRQGDIIRDVELVGAFNLNTIQRTLNSDDEVVRWSMPSPLKKSLTMILSNSCEIALENDIKVTSIILAPIRGINEATSPDKIQEVIESNIIDPRNPRPSFLKYFYLVPHKKLGFADGGIVDFSKLFSVHKTSYDRLRERKILQLRPEIASQMAYKLALYFFRRL